MLSRLIGKADGIGIHLESTHHSLAYRRLAVIRLVPFAPRFVGRLPLPFCVVSVLVPLGVPFRFPPVLATFGVPFRFPPVLATLGLPFRFPPVLATFGVPFRFPPVWATLGVPFRFPPVLATLGVPFRFPPVLAAFFVVFPVALLESVVLLAAVFFLGERLEPSVIFRSRRTSSRLSSR